MSLFSIVHFLLFGRPVKSAFIRESIHISLGFGGGRPLTKCQKAKSSQINQTTIKKNQASILKNQASILKNQGALNAIIANQKQILARLNQ